MHDRRLGPRRGRLGPGPILVGPSLGDARFVGPSLVDARLVAARLVAARLIAARLVAARARRRLERDREPEGRASALDALEANLAAELGRERLRDEESHAEPGERVVGRVAVRSVVALEHPLLRPQRDPDPVILDADARVRALPHDPHEDEAAPRREANRVVHENVHDLPHSGDVEPGLHALGLEAKLVAGSPRAQLGEHVRDRAVDGELRRLERSAPQLEARDIEQLLHEHREPVALPLERPERDGAARHEATRVPFVHELRVALDRRHGRLQLVRGRGEELVARAQRGLRAGHELGVVEGERAAAPDLLGEGHVLGAEGLRGASEERQRPEHLAARAQRHEQHRAERELFGDPALFGGQPRRSPGGVGARHEHARARRLGPAGFLGQTAPPEPAQRDVAPRIDVQADHRRGALAAAQEDAALRQPRQHEPRKIAQEILDALDVRREPPADVGQQRVARGRTLGARGGRAERRLRAREVGGQPLGAEAPAHEDRREQKEKQRTERPAQQDGARLDGEVEAEDAKARRFAHVDRESPARDTEGQHADVREVLRAARKSLAMQGIARTGRAELAGLAHAVAELALALAVDEAAKDRARVEHRADVAEYHRAALDERLGHAPPAVVREQRPEVAVLRDGGPAGVACGREGGGAPRGLREIEADEVTEGVARLDEFHDGAAVTRRFREEDGARRGKAPLQLERVHVCGELLRLHLAARDVEAAQRVDEQPVILELFFDRAVQSCGHGLAARARGAGGDPRHEAARREARREPDAEREQGGPVAKPGAACVRSGHGCRCPHPRRHAVVPAGGK